MKNGDMPVYPNVYTDPQTGRMDTGDTGLTKREYFAALAMQGLVSYGMNDLSASHSNRIAQVALNQADALLEALEE